jgi:integrase
MVKRRSNHEGSIFKRENGSWRAQVSIEGRRLSYKGKTQKECQKWLRETNNNIEEGFTYKKISKRFQSFAEDWLVSISSSRSKTTTALYDRTMRIEIFPFLGKSKLIDLTPEVIQRLYDHLIKQGKSGHAVHTIHKVLNVSLEHAVRLGMIIRNPCKSTSPPKPETTEMKIFDENQIHTFLNTANSLNDQYYVLYYLAFNTGMRISELIGLKWDDLDWERNSIRVRRQLLRFKGGGFEFTKPKSKSGSRTILIGENTMEELKKHREKVMSTQLDFGENWKDLNLIFPTRVGTPIVSQNLRRGFRKVLQVSGLPKIRFHDIRHTAASLMLNYGISVLIVSRRLGHSKPSITLDVYGHLIPSKDEEATVLLDELIAPIKVDNCTIFAPDQ